MFGYLLLNLSHNSVQTILQYLEIAIDTNSMLAQNLLHLTQIDFFLVQNPHLLDCGFFYKLVCELIGHLAESSYHLLTQLRCLLLDFAVQRNDFCA